MSVFSLYFEQQQEFLLILSLLFFLVSLLILHSKYQKYSIIPLVFSALSLFIFAASLDPFLNIWDERFHALVAKNLMSHPLMPTLYDNPVLSLKSDSWDQQHIWLHKQPLFLWQIALSFKLFGVSEFSLRLPSVFLAVVLVVVAYRCGKLLVNLRTGYFSALMVFTSMYITGLISGRRQLDHNDISFVSYISLSIWSFLEYNNSGKRIWLLFIGLFSGMAVLCKWVVGLLVYWGWFSLNIINNKYRLKEYRGFILSFLITIVVALPWQILSYVWYPNEAAVEMNLNSQHFFSAVEGHGGDFWYHFVMFDTLYGALASFFIIPAFLVLYKYCVNRNLFYFSLISVITIYMFFSLAATKMPSFTLVVALFIFVSFATLIDHILQKIEHYLKNPIVSKIVLISIVLLFIHNRYNIEKLHLEHTNINQSNFYYNNLLNNKKVFENLNLPENTVLFNVKGRHYIEAMFYTGLPAYNFIPTQEQLIELHKKNYIVAIFTSDDVQMPVYLQENSSTIFLKDDIILCE